MEVLLEILQLVLVMLGVIGILYIYSNKSPLFPRERPKDEHHSWVRKQKKLQNGGDPCNIHGTLYVHNDRDDTWTELAYITDVMEYNDTPIWRVSTVTDALLSCCATPASYRFITANGVTWDENKLVYHLGFDVGDPFIYWKGVD